MNKCIINIMFFQLISNIHLSACLVYKSFINLLSIHQLRSWILCTGAHTIGRATCGVIQERLYNYSATGKPDPSLNPKYLNFLRRKCRWATDYVDLDATTPNKFDNAYYSNLPKKMGLLSSDSALYTDSRTSPIVKALAYQPSIFRHQFAVSMAKLGNVQVLTDLFEGEIRTKCSCRNSP